MVQAKQKKYEKNAKGRGSSGKKIESIRSEREQKINLNIRKYANKKSGGSRGVFFLE